MEILDKPNFGNIQPINGERDLTIMSLADFLFTQRQQRLLSALLMHPGRDYSMGELVALSGSGSGAGQNQIEKLVEAGLVLEERVRNQRRLRINQGFPLYPELRSICVKSFGVVEALRAILAPIEDEIAEAFVFGSVAKGTDTADSDIDLLVVGSVSLLDLNRHLAEAERTFSRTVNVQLYSASEWSAAQSDSVITAITNGPRLQVIPDAESASRDPEPDGRNAAGPQGSDR